MTASGRRTGMWTLLLEYGVEKGGKLVDKGHHAGLCDGWWP